MCLYGSYQESRKRYATEFNMEAAMESADVGVGVVGMIPEPHSEAVAGWAGLIGGRGRGWPDMCL